MLEEILWQGCNRWLVGGIGHSEPGNELVISLGTE